jgi:hypothetical protein
MRKPKPDNAPRSKLLGYSTAREPEAGKPPAGAESRFLSLLERCVREAGSLRAAQLTSHPAFLEIVSMGEDAVPFLLAGLDREKPEGWLPALQRVAGVNPVSPASRGNPKAMAEDWLRWGRGRGIMPKQAAADAVTTEGAKEGSVSVGVGRGAVTLRADATLTPEEAERAAARLVDAARRARARQA